MKKRFSFLLAAILSVAISVPVLAAPVSQPKFNLTVYHLDGTSTLGDNEVIYEVTPNKGGIGGYLYYAATNECYSNGTLITSVTKGLWFSGRGAQDYGDAYFFAFGDTCIGVVRDRETGEIVSNTVTFSTNPLPRR
jgi:hypothetical protein